MREPFIARFPGRIPAGSVVHGMATTMDLMPTVAGLCGVSAPANLDGVDIWPMLDGEREEVNREVFLYFDFWNIQCARLGSWKLHVTRNNTFPWTPDPVGGRFNLPLPRPELYDLENDPEESYDAADDYPEVVAEIRLRIEQLLPTFPDQVQQYWRDTFSKQVIDTASGALPIMSTP
jgi:arylsulfatase A-like enzyme